MEYCEARYLDSSASSSSSSSSSHQREREREKKERDFIRSFADAGAVSVTVFFCRGD